MIQGTQKLEEAGSSRRWPFVAKQGFIFMQPYLSLHPPFAPNHCAPTESGMNHSPWSLWKRHFGLQDGWAPTADEARECCHPSPEAMCGTVPSCEASAAARAGVSKAARFLLEIRRVQLWPSGGRKGRERSPLLGLPCSPRVLLLKIIVSHFTCF